MLKGLVTVVVMLCACPGAWAQVGFFGGPSYNPLAVPVTVPEAEFLARRAGLDEEGTRAARTLTESSIESLKRAARRSQRQAERAHIVHPREEREQIKQEITQAREAHTAAHASITKAILADLRALVPQGEPGDSAWIAFERRRHRRLYLPQSTRIGAGVNLVEIAERIKIDSNPEIRRVLDRYEVDLDGLLLARLPIALDHDERFDTLVSQGSEAEAEKLFIALRDADCALVRVQRAAARSFLAAVPAESKGRAEDLILAGRSFMGEHPDAIRVRAEQLIKGGRIKGEKLESLRAGAAAFDAKSRTLDESWLTNAEDEQCSQTFAQHRAGAQLGDPYAQLERERQLRAALLGVIESVATEEDLDSVRPSWEQNE